MTVSITNLLTQILNDSIKFDDIETRLADIEAATVGSDSHADLTTVLVRFINNERYDLVKALLEKIEVGSYFDRLLKETEDKEQHGIDSPCKNLRHYVISEVFKTVPTSLYDKTIFEFIITKFKLTEINYLQLLVNVPTDQPEVIELATRKILGESTIEIRHIIPYMVEYFKQPDSLENRAAILQLLNTLKAINIVNDTDLTRLVEAVVLNEHNQQHVKNAIKQLPLSKEFVHDFIQLIPTRGNEVDQNSNTSYLDLVDKVISQFKQSSDLSPWVSNNLAEFIAWLPQDRKVSYLKDRNFLTSLFRDAVPQTTITAVLDASLNSSGIKSSEMASILASYKENPYRNDQGYVGLKWAIENLPLADAGTTLIDEIQKLLDQQTTIDNGSPKNKKPRKNSQGAAYDKLAKDRFADCKVLYQTLISCLDTALKDKNASQEQQEALTTVFDKMVKQICSFTYQNLPTESGSARLELLNYILTCCESTSLFSQQAILDTWLNGLLQQNLEKNCYSNEQRAEDLTKLYEKSIIEAREQKHQQGINEREIEKEVYQPCVKEFTQQSKNRKNLKTGAKQKDFSHSAYPVKVFGLLGYTNFLLTPTKAGEKHVKDKEKRIKALVDILKACSPALFNEQTLLVNKTRSRSLFKAARTTESPAQLGPVEKIQKIAMQFSGGVSKKFLSSAKELNKWLKSGNHLDSEFLSQHVTNFLAFIDEVIEKYQGDKELDRASVSLFKQLIEKDLKNTSSLANEVSVASPEMPMEAELATEAEVAENVTLNKTHSEEKVEFEYSDGDQWYGPTAFVAKLNSLINENSNQLKVINVWVAASEEEEKCLGEIHAILEDQALLNQCEESLKTWIEDNKATLINLLSTSEQATHELTEEISNSVEDCLLFWPAYDEGIEAEKYATQEPLIDRLNSLLHEDSINSLSMLQLPNQSGLYFDELLLVMPSDMEKYEKLQKWFNDNRDSLNHLLRLDDPTPTPI